VRAEERQRTAEDSFGPELTQEIDRVMCGFDLGSREVLRLMLKYGELTERGARSRVEQSGLMTSQTTFLYGLAERTGWLLKTQSSPHPHVSRDEDRYEIAPRIRPYLIAWFEKNR